MGWYYFDRSVFLFQQNMCFEDSFFFLRSSMYIIFFTLTLIDRKWHISKFLRCWRRYFKFWTVTLHSGQQCQFLAEIWKRPLDLQTCFATVFGPAVLIIILKMAETIWRIISQKWCYISLKTRNLEIFRSLNTYLRRNIQNSSKFNFSFCPLRSARNYWNLEVATFFWLVMSFGRSRDWSSVKLKIRVQPYLQFWRKFCSEVLYFETWK